MRKFTPKVEVLEGRQVMSADMVNLIAPFDAKVYFEAVGGEAGANSDVGVILPNGNPAFYITGLPNAPTTGEQYAMDIQAGQVLHLGMRTQWGGMNYFAASDGTNSPSNYVFADAILTKVGANTWQFSVDDAASTDQDNNDVIFNVRFEEIPAQPAPEPIIPPEEPAPPPVEEDPPVTEPENPPTNVTPEPTPDPIPTPVDDLPPPRQPTTPDPIPAPAPIPSPEPTPVPTPPVYKPVPQPPKHGLFDSIEVNVTPGQRAYVRFLDASTAKTPSEVTINFSFKESIHNTSNKLDSSVKYYDNAVVVKDNANGCFNITKTNCEERYTLCVSKNGQMETSTKNEISETVVKGSDKSEEVKAEPKNDKSEKVETKESSSKSDKDEKKGSENDNKGKK